jgi:hypothetical protein
MNRFAAVEQADAFEQCSEQDKRDRKMNDEWMEAPYELTKVAALDTVRWSVQGGQ